MEPPDSSFLRFGERFLSMSSRCGHWFWADGWHLSWVWRLRNRFLTFRSRISTAEDWKCQHEGQTILFFYSKALTVSGICHDACWNDVFRCLRQQRLIVFWLMQSPLIQSSLQGLKAKIRSGRFPLWSFQLSSALVVTFGGGNSKL